LSSVENTSVAKSVLNVAKPGKAMETGNPKTNRATAIDGKKVEETAVSPTTEASETKPKDAVPETGLSIYSTVRQAVFTTTSSNDRFTRRSLFAIVHRVVDHDFMPPSFLL
jgi:hypothetical protein